MSDYSYGKQQEAEMFPVLQQFFGHWLLHNKNDFAAWDYEEPEWGVAVELKSRHCRSTDYPTAMIKTLKVTNCERATAAGRECFLFFRYIDRLMYIQFDAATFAGYERRTMKIPSRADKEEVYESRTFIPIADLKTLRVFVVDCLID